MRVESLPAKLRETGLFCCWRYEQRQNKPTKVPYDPRTGGRAKSTDPATFAPLSVALEAMERGKYDGLGVGIFGSLGAIDIDHCLSDTGEISPMAVDIACMMDAYVEKSPSGKGLRILFTVPEGFTYDKAQFYINNQRAGLEVYIAGCTNKYVTVTGDTSIPGFDLQERGEQLRAVLEKYMRRPDRQAPQPPRAPAALDELQLIEKAKRSRGGERFAALWAGDTAGYNSHSEADIALCNYLSFWTNRDPDRMDRLFRQSGLMREKWDRQQSGSTYGAITIQNAISNARSGYDSQAGSGHALGWDGTPETGSLSSASTGPVKPPDYSDAGNATVFFRIYQNDLIFVDALGWLYWNGRHWERSDHHAVACALDLSERMLKEALHQYSEAQQRQAEAMTRFAETGNDGDKSALAEAKEAVKMASAYLSHAKNSRNAVRIKNMMELSKPALVLKADRLDANPFDLNTPAGIVNLTTGQLRPHERTAYCSQITQAAPGNKGRDMWEAFLDTVTCGDGSLKGFLQMVTGMAFIGSVYQEGLVIACGGGRNGKSTAFNAIGDTLGDYAGTIDIKTITTDRANKGASLATLRGKRLVVTGELEEHQRLSVATLKQVASTDKLTIEEKYKQPETVKQSHTLVLFTNHLPRVGSTDDGTWRRLIVVPFNAIIPPGKSVQNYGEVLAQECGGAILAWGIEGAVDFVRNGFKLDIPLAVEAATEDYRQREDWLTNFINERCIRDPNAREGARALYLEYKAWAQDGGEFVRRESDFASAMEKAGFQKTTVRGKPRYYGLHIDHGEKPYGTWVGYGGA